MKLAGTWGRTFGFTSLAALECLGCSRTIYVRQPLSSNDIESVNAEARDHNVDVTLRTDEGDKTTTGTGTGLSIGITRVMWQGDIVKTSSLLKVHAVDHAAGAGEGLGIGALSGVFIGGLFGLATASSNNSGGPELTVSPGFAALIGALVCSLPGALIGAIVGGAVGDRTTYVFDENPASR
jgi:hypothetical protein